MAVVCECRFPVCLSSCCGKRRFPPTWCPHPETVEGSQDPPSVCTAAPQPERRTPPAAAVKVPTLVLATSEWTSFCLREINHLVASHVPQFESDALHWYLYIYEQHIKLYPNSDDSSLWTCEVGQEEGGAKRREELRVIAYFKYIFTSVFQIRTFTFVQLF